MSAARKQHYLAGIIHEDKLFGRRVQTQWATTKPEADAICQEMRAVGATWTRVLCDGRSGFRIVGWWP